MSSINEHLARILDVIRELNNDGHIIRPDEFVAVSDIEIAVHEARKAFERTKNVNIKENQ